MSIEQNLDRIATALEKLVSMAPTAAPVAEAPAENPKPKRTRKVVQNKISQPEPTAVQQPVDPALTNSAPAMTSEQLLAHAQKLAQGLGDRALEFTSVVRTHICPKYQADRVINIPAASVAAAKADMDVAAQNIASQVGGM